MNRIKHMFGVIVAALAVLAVPIGVSVPLAVTTGCAKVQPGNSTYLVRAEQAQQFNFNTVDSFLRFEKNNRDALWALNKEIKKVADDLRVTFPPADESLKRAIDTYKQARTTANEDAIAAALAVVEVMKDEAVKWHAIAAKR